MKRSSGLVVAFLAAGSVMWSVGCKPSLPPPKLGAQKWQRESIGGPIELRPLPPSSNVLSDYGQWLRTPSPPKARLYEAIFVGSSNQQNFKLTVEKADTPAVFSETTHVTFTYRDPTKGEYRIRWYRLGKHTADFLRLTDQPKQLWLVPNFSVDHKGVPELVIEAFEGLEPTGVYIAKAGDTNASIQPFTDIEPFTNINLQP